MKKYLLHLVTAICISGIIWPGHAIAQQSKQAKNNVYLEFAGNAFFYSFNYEHHMGKNIYGRLGFSFGTVRTELAGGRERKDGTLITIPLMINFLSGENAHHLELGAGLTPFIYSEENPDNDIFDVSGSTVLFSSVIGYRYQKPEGGFLFKLGFTPLTNFKVFAPWAGISLGYSF